MYPYDIVFFSIASLLPPVLLLTCWNFLLERKRKRQLLNEKILREPGHSLRIQRAEVTEKFVTHLAICWILPFVIALSIAKLKPSPWVTVSIILVIGIVSTVIGFRLISLTSKHQNLTQGLNGEIIVSQQLDALREDGYITIHDVPIKYGNIDHVAVGMGGIFAVECKTRKKVINATNGTCAKVKYRQGALHFPDGYNEEMIRQTERQASELADYLSKLVGAQVQVTPVLVLPGWYIDRSERTPFPIVSHKELGQIMRRPQTALTETQVKQVVAALEERCRDVVV